MNLSRLCRSRINRKKFSRYLILSDPSIGGMYRKFILAAVYLLGRQQQQHKIGRSLGSRGPRGAPDADAAVPPPPQQCYAPP